FQNTLLRVRSKHVDQRYLLWFFAWLARSGQFARGSRGVGIHHLGAKALSDWLIPIAPLAEQERIVAAIEEQFSRLDAGVAALERARENIMRMRAAISEVAVTEWVGKGFPQGNWSGAGIGGCPGLVFGEHDEGGEETEAMLGGSG
ncbi:MAG: hypothetical protein ACLQI7_08030, partial [Streptosporangiaceae bacterium]